MRAKCRHGEVYACVYCERDNFISRITALEAELKRAKEEAADWEGRYMALYTNGPLYRKEAALNEIREIYAGMEGPIVAETAHEGYYLRVIEQMWDAARRALEGE